MKTTFLIFVFAVRVFAAEETSAIGRIYIDSDEKVLSERKFDGLSEASQN